jgi:hypothetical protein
VNGDDVPDFHVADLLENAAFILHPEMLDFSAVISVRTSWLCRKGAPLCYVPNT